MRVLGAGVACFLVAYVGFAATGASIAVLAVCFVAAGVAIGCVETAEHAAVARLAPEELRGSAFGLLAGVQSFGNLGASAIAGVLWTLVVPRRRPAVRRGPHGLLPRVHRVGCAPGARSVIDRARHGTLTSLLTST